jgi:lon-related putative ATP-dependent protease
MPGVALPPALLYRRCDPAQLVIREPGKQAEPAGLVGQERAVEAVGFAINIRKKGFNLVVLGPAGTGRHTLVKELLEERAKTEPTPSDWCYVNNFTNPQRPRKLRLPPGRAQSLRQTMEKLVQELRVSLPAAFEREDYRSHRETLAQHFKQRHEEAFGGLQRRAEKKDIALVRTPTGLALVPMRNGEAIQEDAFEKMPSAEQEHIRQNISSLQVELEALVRNIPIWEGEHRKDVRKLNRDTAGAAVGYLLEEVRRGYLDLPQVLDYLHDVEHDIMENTDDFLAANRTDEEGPLAALASVNARTSSAFRRYRVNIMVDNGNRQGAPVIYEDRPTHQTLVGRIEHLAQFGALVTDFNLVISGALHRANGGYLVIDLERLLQGNFGYDSLKRALRSEEIRLESLEQLLSLASTATLEPEPIPLDVKVVLIGPASLYYLLLAHDSDIPELFKVVADFEDRVARTEETVSLYAQNITDIVKKEKLRPLNQMALARVIECASRQSDDAEKLSTRIQTLVDLLQEADCRAGMAGLDMISEAMVEEALAAQSRRADKIYRRILEEIGRKTIHVDMSGSCVGQINGLAVLPLGHLSFGHPCRITARVGLGRGDLVDIERQVDLGGALHSKGILILAGFLKGRYGRKARLSLDASLVFEQSYTGIDGDSASAAELFALLSALAELPIAQDFAVTGSVDQQGNIQAVGAVNEKIEGYFDACLAAGLTGKQGGLIPGANIKHLMLRRDVVQACEVGSFRVIPIETVDQGIAVLTGMPAGEADLAGKYPPDTVNHWISARLAAFTRLQNVEMGRSRSLDHG